MGGPGGSRGTVIVLEDDPGINRLLRAHLERAGYEVKPALSTTEAHAQLRSGSADLLILDYELGNELSGLEFYRTLQTEGLDRPAILVTGFSDEKRLVEALRAGVRDYILKTPNFVELVAPTVDRVMRQVRAERQLIEAEAASRAKDHFLATLSHELRTPLTPVLALVSAMQKDERLPADVLDDMATIARNIELEARLIDDMLDLTRIVRGKLELRMEAVDIRPIVEHAVKSCCTQEAADKMIICHRELAEDPHVAQVDPARLTQVIWNLLRNAIKFTPAGGHIWIRSRFEDVDGRTWVGLEISDSGIGIDPAVLPRIFGAFEQGDVQITRKFGGLGLGLAISKAIIDLHGGEITAASGGAGKGASFTIRLPLSDVPKARVTAAPFAASFSDAPAEAGAHLLLVEDHTDTAQVLARMLRRAGYHVTVARSVAQALAATEAAHISPDETGHLRPVRLVISDLGLPDGSGNDLMRQLRERYQIRGLALSGFGMEEDLRRSAAAGFAQHLTKPVEVEVLLRAIRELMAEA